MAPDELRWLRRASCPTLKRTSPRVCSHCQSESFARIAEHAGPASCDIVGYTPRPEFWQGDPFRHQAARLAFPIVDHAASPRANKIQPSSMCATYTQCFQIAGSALVGSMFLALEISLPPACTKLFHPQLGGKTVYVIVCITPSPSYFSPMGLKKTY
jgi:hypothetical protein